MPTPANDNSPSAKSAASALRGLAGLAARRNPYLNALRVGYELYQLVQGPQEAAPGYYQYGQGWSTICRIGNGALYGFGSTSCGSAAIIPVAARNTIYVDPGGNAASATELADVRQNWPFPTQDYGITVAAMKWTRQDPEEVPQLPTYVPPTPARAPQWIPAEQPLVPPMVDPMALPIGAPAPTPDPLPWRMIPARRRNPWRVEQTQRGNAVPGTGPVVDPATGPTIELAPGQAPKVTPGRHERRPPRRGERERKALASARGVALLLMNGVTESVDAIEAIHAALPEHLQAESGKPQDMAWAIWQGLDELDLPQALLNLLANQIEDAIIGRANSATGSLDRAVGKPINRPGYGFGPAI